MGQWLNRKPGKSKTVRQKLNAGYTLCTNYHKKGNCEKMTICEWPWINHYTLFIVHPAIHTYCIASDGIRAAHEKFLRQFIKKSLCREIGDEIGSAATFWQTRWIWQIMSYTLFAFCNFAFLYCVLTPFYGSLHIVYSRHKNFWKITKLRKKEFQRLQQNWKT